MRVENNKDTYGAVDPFAEEVRLQRSAVRAIEAMQKGQKNPAEVRPICLRDCYPHSIPSAA